MKSFKEGMKLWKDVGSSYGMKGPIAALRIADKTSGCDPL